MAEKDLSLPGEEPEEACGRLEQKVVVVIASNVFGSGNDELGAKLMKNFLASLPEFGPDLWRLILLNGGVKLAVKGSLVLDELGALEKAGTKVLSCGACLEFYKLTRELAAGETTNMLDVVTSMQLADKVIKI
jgi:selenium metabolism protein YedF